MFEQRAAGNIMPKNMPVSLAILNLRFTGQHSLISS
jgi:hypothetical protein